MSNPQNPSPWSRDSWSTTGTPRPDGEPTQPLGQVSDPGPQAAGPTAAPQQPQTSPTMSPPQGGPSSYASYQSYPTQGTTFPQPSTATQPKAKGRSRVAGVLALTLLAVGAGGAAGFAGAQLSTGTDSATASSSASAGAVETQVVQADPSNPDWATVAAAASKAVVAIQVAGADGSGGQGSGVIIDSEGHIVTNNHVVSGVGSSAQITVLLGNTSYAATVVGTDPSTDLAVIKFVNPPSDLAVMGYGDNTKLAVGDPVMAIGNPLGLADTVTTGIVSALNRPVTTRAVTENSNTGRQNSSDVVVTAAIQTNAAINPGNSGGALVNTSGELVGITSSIASLSSSSESQAGNIGIGFAIGSDQVRYVVDQLIESGTAQHPQLGVSARDISGTGTLGAEVVAVTPGSGAAAGGLQVGDLITSVDGQPVMSTESLVALVRAGRVGEPMQLGVLRDGDDLTVEVTPGAADN